MKSSLSREINKNSADLRIVWDSLKAYLRGTLFNKIHWAKKVFQKKELELKEQVKMTSENFKLITSEENYQKVRDAQAEYKKFLLDKAQHAVFFSGQRKFIEGGGSWKIVVSYVIRSLMLGLSLLRLLTEG